MKDVERRAASSFKVKPVAAALAIAMGAAFVAPNAGAVNFAEDGLGEVLLYQYYTVRNGFDTNINITNTSDKTVAFKIRFREGYNSRDARDFNVVLSPFDVWNGTVTESPDGTRARFRTSDTSCTVPQLPIALGGTTRAVDFTNFDYTGANADGGPTGFERTKEGYIEVIQMGTSDFPVSGIPEGSPFRNSVAWNAKHVNGVPRNCNAVVSGFGANLANTVIEFDEPENVLKGTASLVNVQNGQGASYQPVVLANFFNPEAVDGVSSLNLITDPASRVPALDDVNPQIASLWGDEVDFPLSGDFADPMGAVSALLSRTSVINQFSVNPANNALTDWVVTFPTKYYYVDNRFGSPLVGNDPLPPFDRDQNTTVFQVDKNGTPFDVATAGPDAGRSCVTVGFKVWDREEFQPDVPDELQFSPPPPDSPESVICKEVNVITFNDSDLFGSALSENVNTPEEFGITSGWMQLNFPRAGEIEGGFEIQGITGLPVIGFAMTSLENGVAGANLLNYGLIFDHAYTRAISVAD